MWYIKNPPASLTGIDQPFSPQCTKSRGSTRNFLEPNTHFYYRRPNRGSPTHFNKPVNQDPSHVFIDFVVALKRDELKVPA